MAYDTTNLKNNQGGSTLEKSDSANFEAGLWEHPETGNQLITTYDPLFGNAQSEGVARLGFVRVGDAPEGSITTIVEQSIAAESKKSDVSSDVLKRLGDLEAERKENLVDQAELADLRREKAERELAESKATAPKVSEPVVEDEKAPAAPTKTDNKKKEDK